MPLEATIIGVDNSEFTRNGDYMPTRLDAQKDAVNLLCSVKIQQNAESTVGIVCNGGSNPKVLCSCTQDMAVLLTASSEIKVSGKADFSRALQVSNLALKNRRNKNGGQRVVMFVASPMNEEPAQLVKLAKTLKKNNIAVDVVSMGENEVNEPKLKAFMEAVNKNGNSHLITIPTGVLPSDVLLSSPIVNEGEDGGGGGGGGGAAGHAGGAGGLSHAFAEYGGVDPSLDPELAMVLRASLEEERAVQQAQQAQQQAAGAPAEAGQAAPTTATTTTTTEVPSDMPPLTRAVETTPVPTRSGGGGGGAVDEDEEALLQQALLMSMNEVSTVTPPSQGMELDDDIAKALQASSAAAAAPATTKPSSTTTSAPPSTAPALSSTTFNDPAFINQILGSLPDVDLNDPQIQSLLASLQGGSGSGSAGAPAPTAQESEKKRQKPTSEDDKATKATTTTWTCQACTMDNPSSVDVCETCGTPKDFSM